ncbi:hypothetical protein [Streptomyces sp. NPDC049555]|uniref:hypothetical protein n=2 Tax=unclassified Streptomyces TaxID=2593676 RepID=UPI003414A4C5
MPQDGDPHPPHPPMPPHPPDNRFWSRVWTYWVTAGLAIVLAAAIPAIMQAGPFAPNHPPPPSPSPTPVLSTTTTIPPTPPSPTPTPVRVSARITSIVPMGAVTPTVTKVQLIMTWTGLKGRSGYVKWYTYNDATKIRTSDDSTISTPALNWDSTDWKPTFIVPTPPVHWQLQVTAYAPDGTQLTTAHSTFTFAGS